MNLFEYRDGLKAFYEAHEHEWPEKSTPWDNFMRDKAIENAYKKTLPEPVPFRWFDGKDRQDYKNSFLKFDEYGFVSGSPVFFGPFADIA